MNEKQLMNEIEKLCKDGHTDAFALPVSELRRCGNRRVQTWLPEGVLDRIGCFQFDRNRLYRSHRGHHETVRQKELIKGRELAKQWLSSFRLFDNGLYGGDCYGNQK